MTRRGEFCTSTVALRRELGDVRGLRSSRRLSVRDREKNVGQTARRRRRGGFTLLELLAASALSAVLMVVLLQVIGSLARSRVVFERDAAERTPWEADLVETLRWDLVNATEATAEPGRLVLVGHGSLEKTTLAPEHQPVTVVYALEQLGGRRWLVRRQSPRGALTNERGWSELVCPDVSSFAVEAVMPPTPGSRGGRPTPPAAARRTRGPVTLDAGTATVRIRVSGTAGTIVDRVVELR